MPLGQQPYGSRPEGSGQRPKTPFRMSDPRRWMLIASAVIMVGFLVYDFSRPRPKLEPERACLTDKTCDAGYRCLTVPKGDGFPTQGVCAKECTDGGQCGVPLSCQPVKVVEQHVESSGEGIGPMMVCRLTSQK